MSEEVKQVIVVRRDLNMRKGKMCAQVAHASAAFLRNSYFSGEDYYGTTGEDHLDLSEEERRWFLSDYRKIVVWVKTKQELLDLHALANKAPIQSYLQYDNGATEFHGEKTLTCLAIGPDVASAVDQVTGGLPLL